MKDKLRPADLKRKQPNWANPRPMTVPEGAIPIVQFIFRKCIELDYCMTRVCKEAGVSQDTLSSWRQGCNPRVDILVKILDVMGFKLAPVSHAFYAKLMRRSNKTNGLKAKRVMANDDDEEDAD